MNDRYFSFLEGQAANITDAAVRGAISHVVKLHRHILATTTYVRGNTDLSAKGRAKEGRTVLGKHAWELIRANAMAQRLGARVDEKRAKIQLPVIDKMDAAGAVLRSQVRDRLTGKSAAEIRSLIPSMTLLQVCAVLEAPELIGADRDIVGAVHSRAMDILHPGTSAALDAERDAVRLLTNATAELSKAACDLAELPNSHALNDFLNQTVPDTRHIEADVERETAIAA